MGSPTSYIMAYLSAIFKLNRRNVFKHVEYVNYTLTKMLIDDSLHVKKV